MIVPINAAPQILQYVDTPQTLVRASQVSHRWREILNDDAAWKALSDRDAYRRMSSASLSSLTNSPLMASNALHHNQVPHNSTHDSTSQRPAQHHTDDGNNTDLQRLYPYLDLSRLPPGSSLPPGVMETLREIAPDPILAPPRHHEAAESSNTKRPKITHRSQYKHRFMVESAWRKGGKVMAHQITPDQGVVTSLHMTAKFIVLSMDTARIHVFNIEGTHLRCLEGHVMGVWAMVPWEDTLVSGGCDRDVRVWNMETGYDFSLSCS